MRENGSRAVPWVDPDLVPILGRIPELRLSDESLGEMRRALLASRPPASDDLPVTSCERVATAPGAATDVAVVVHSPVSAGGPRPAIIQIHGGGLVMGNADVVTDENRRLAAELDCCVIAVDYRLAPEHPFPAALEDCYTVLAWVNDNAGLLDIDPSRVVVKGESAGGGLAASLCQLARDRGEYRIAFQHLTYPMLDDRTCTRTDLPAWAGSLVWTVASNTYGWGSYLGERPGAETAEAYAVAARCPDLSDLPPAYVVVGALDLFLEESAAYALRLARDGVPVEFQVVAGACHSFLSFGAGTDLGARVGFNSTDALRRACSNHGTGVVRDPAALVPDHSPTANSTKERRS